METVRSPRIPQDAIPIRLFPKEPLSSKRSTSEIDVNDRGRVFVVATGNVHKAMPIVLPTSDNGTDFGITTNQFYSGFWFSSSNLSQEHSHSLTSISMASAPPSLLRKRKAQF